MLQWLGGLQAHQDRAPGETGQQRPTTTWLLGTAVATGARAWSSRNQSEPSPRIPCGRRSCQAGTQYEETPLCGQKLNLSGALDFREGRKQPRERCDGSWGMARCSSQQVGLNLSVLSEGMQSHFFFCFLEMGCNSCLRHISTELILWLKY